MIEFAVVEVEDLPWPGQPGTPGSFCFLNEFAAEVWDQRLSRADHQRANADIIKARVEDETIHDCWFHRQPWKLVSLVAIQALGRIHADEPLDWARAETSLQAEARDPAEVIKQARKLVSRDDAISWTPAYPESIGNGMHRICAMKAQGVEKTVVRVS
jgi:hypothetical protein